MNKTVSFTPLQERLSRKLSAIVLVASLALSASVSGADIVSVTELPLFSQDFSESNTLADYVGTGANQLDGFTGSVTLGWSVSNGILTGQRTAGGNGSFAKSGLKTDSGNQALGAVYSFDFELISTALASGSFVTFGAGSDYVVDGNAPTDSNSHSRFSITRTSGGWAIGGLSGATGTSATYTGKEKITFVTNTSDAAFSYSAPSGTSVTLSANTWNVWVGTDLALSGTSMGASIDPTGFKLRLGATGTDAINITLDNFSVAALHATQVPEPGTIAIIAGILAIVAVFGKRIHGRRQF
ncbi:hypothetical protein Ga0100231_012905 [Opitutaceae bacterium TAV4]|nr:hypothetical protein Ga0100231_012905 [Opitutaceae bacterium TAV4]RRJ99331.1 hypothetical protein Ga0100230_014200 [Opitutaceae bacterium TAV3]